MKNTYYENKCIEKYYKDKCMGSMATGSRLERSNTIKSSPQIDFFTVSKKCYIVIQIGLTVKDIKKCTERQGP